MEPNDVARAVLVAAGVAGALLALYLLSALYRAVRWITRPSASQTAARAEEATAAAASSSAKAAASAATAEQNRQSAHDRGKNLKTLVKDSEKASKKKEVSKDEIAAAHELFLNTLKGHGDVVHGIAWSSDGLSLATACEDMYLRIFDVSDLASREPRFKRVKTAKIPLGVGWGDGPETLTTVMKGIPDAIAAQYGPVGGAKAGEGATFEEFWQVPNAHGKELPLTMRSVPSSASAGRIGLLFSCTTKKDVRVFNMQGREVAMLEPNSLANHDLAVSYDGRFVAVATFTAEVKIWEMKYGKEGGCSGAAKAMELKGHKSQVNAVALSNDNKRAVTASKDGTLRVWNICVRYGMSEDAKTLVLVPLSLPPGKVYSHMAIAPGSKILAASFEGRIHLINMATGVLIESIDAHDGPITALAWCPKIRKAPVVPGSGSGAGALLAVLASSSRDKRVRLWGWKMDI
ncbi:MAG: hypothetical protein WDW38_008932 [Sanguina aurantia]